MDTIKWNVKWTCEKWRSDADREAGLPPYEVLVQEHNVATALGLNELLKVFTGTGGTPFSSGTTYMYVGDSALDAASGQTDLQGVNKAEVIMDTGYPQVSNQHVTFRGTFDGSSANFTWNEAGIKNGAGAPGGAVILLNRRVVSFGAKTVGVSWTLNGLISLA